MFLSVWRVRVSHLFSCVNYFGFLFGLIKSAVERISLMVKIILLLAVILALSACDGDGVLDKSSDERMTREAMCVVASERFLLYDEAERHLKHGLEAGRVRFESTGETNDFAEQIDAAREVMNSMSKSFNAEFLRTQCDKEISVNEFERVFS